MTGESKSIPWISGEIGFRLLYCYGNRSGAM